MDTFQPSRAGRHAYMQRTLKAQRRAEGNAVSGAGRAIRQAGGVGADIFRHALTVIGVVGLVGIAVGALTDSPTYYTILNWITHWFA